MELRELISKLHLSYTYTLTCTRLGIVMKEREDARDELRRHCILERGAIRVDWYFWGYTYNLFTERSGIDICRETVLAEWVESGKR